MSGSSAGRVRVVACAVLEIMADRGIAAGIAQSEWDGVTVAATFSAGAGTARMS
jgi:uncharacterized membrane protein